jgi:phosphohistidine phosphatase SixA
MAEPPILLIRHSRAGDRAAWTQPDHLRPLDDRGVVQAATLPAELAGYEITRILSSPFLRCVQTVEPLATGLGLELEHTDSLAEGSHGGELTAFLASLRGTAAALCSHGDVIGHIVGHDRKCKKGSVWVLEWDDDRLEPVRYIKPLG